MKKTSIPSAVLHLPSVLLPVAGSVRWEVSGRVVHDALEDAFRQVPVLRHHLQLDSGQLRPHVLCLLNGQSIAREQALSTALHDGDEIRIFQAISGG